MATGTGPPPLGPYAWHEVISALRKEIKLNRPEDAIYWLNVLLTFGGSSAGKTAARQLWIMAAEDIDDQAVVIRAFAVFQMIGSVAETDHLYFLTYQMCRARKWWEHDEGREVDRLWSKAIGDLKIPGRQKEIPPYALDRHTRRGWEIFRQTRHFDDRFSGTDLGRAKTEYLFRRDGEITPDGWIPAFRTGEPDGGFRPFWAYRRSLQGVAKGDEDVQPNDPLGDEQIVVEEAGTLFDSSGPDK